MSCYTRQLPEFLPPEPTPKDKKSLDAAIRAVLGLPDVHCPEVWAAVKERRGEPGFAKRVRKHLTG